MIDHSDFQETDIPFEIPLPEKGHLTVSAQQKTITYTPHYPLSCLDGPVLDDASLSTTLGRGVAQW